MGIGCISSGVCRSRLWRFRADGWTYVIALSACGFTLGLVYAFTTVATQAVVRPERAGEAAGVTLTSLVTLAGGRRRGIRHDARDAAAVAEVSTGTGIDIDPAWLIAAVLLPAAVAVLVFARSGHKGTLDRR